MEIKATLPSVSVTKFQDSGWILLSLSLNKIAFFPELHRARPKSSFRGLLENQIVIKSEE
jgi:hypothetical protein